jgi:hypothetical protein
VTHAARQNALTEASDRNSRGRILQAVGRKFELGPRGQEIVDGIREALGAVLALVDEHHKMVHIAKANDWFSFRAGPAGRGDLRRDRCHAEATIHDRWTLMVTAPEAQTLHLDAQRLVDWASVKLAPYLPKLPWSDDLPYPPTGGDGGPSGAAEIGIPVWWARRTRN